MRSYFIKLAIVIVVDFYQYLNIVDSYDRTHRVFYSGRVVYDDTNVFARIIRREIFSDRIYEDEQVFAIKDIRPSAPVHVLVIPKKQCISFDDFISTSTNQEIAHFFKVVKAIAVDLGLVDGGYRLVMNHGGDSGQEVFHFHLHILGGGVLSGL